MSLTKVPVVIASTLCLLSAVAWAQPIAEGDLLTTRDGFTLYTFDNDPVGTGKSVCNAPCSGIFPPYLVEDGAAATGAYSVTTRDDGLKQWTYKGKPLYRFFNDQKRGDKMGDGMNRNIWHVARP